MFDFGTETRRSFVCCPCHPHPRYSWRINCLCSRLRQHALYQCHRNPPQRVGHHLRTSRPCQPDRLTHKPRRPPQRGTLGTRTRQREFGYEAALRHISGLKPTASLRSASFFFPPPLDSNLNSARADGLHFSACVQLHVIIALSHVDTLYP